MWEYFLQNSGKILNKALHVYRNHASYTCRNHASYTKCKIPSSTLPQNYDFLFSLEYVTTVFCQFSTLVKYSPFVLFPFEYLHIEFPFIIVCHVMIQTMIRHRERARMHAFLHYVPSVQTEVKMSVYRLPI